MRVLVVEGEPAAAAVLAKGLREHAYAVDDLMQTIVEADDLDDRHRLAIRRVAIQAFDAEFVIVAGTTLEPTDEELEIQPRISERFYRVDAARTHGKDGGAGLGLALARWIARVHGGDVTLATPSTLGSTFDHVTAA